jgi:hypothetical protein
MLIKLFANPMVATAILDRLLHHSHMLSIRGDCYRLGAVRKSGVINSPAGDGPPVGPTSLSQHRRNQPSTDIMNPRVGTILHDAKGQFRMAFDTRLRYDPKKRIV